MLIHKHDDPTHLANKRPIGLHLTIYKLWTRFVTVILSEFTEEHAIHSASQLNMLGGNLLARRFPPKPQHGSAVAAPCQLPLGCSQVWPQYLCNVRQLDQHAQHRLARKTRANHARPGLPTGCKTCTLTHSAISNSIKPLASPPLLCEWVAAPSRAAHSPLSSSSST